MITTRRSNSVQLHVLAAAMALALTNVNGWGQEEGGAPAPRNQTFVKLTNNANAVIAEPVASDPAGNRIVFLTVHPEHANVFNSWIARELARRGYRTMMMNYYGPEQTYDEFLAPLPSNICEACQAPRRSC